ncbi:MAG: carbohydrate ABC transporter substrate-binding protein [Trueperaceae bacterium]|nr:carbohydrate ABC transporter substrate-binding protein [Trueperaceae bacterium]
MKLSRLWVCLALLGATLVLAQPYSLQDERFSWDQLEPFRGFDFRGQQVTLLGPWTEEEQAQFEGLLSYFTLATGAKVWYGASETYEASIRKAAETGNLPNIAIIPQPSLAKDLAAEDLLIPLGDKNKNAVLANYNQAEDWVELASFANGAGQKAFYGFYFNIEPESLVWYSKQAFVREGYQIPESLEALFALSEQIAAEGKHPWCSGFAAGDNTGWPASNWVEDFVLRQSGLEVYDAWVNHQLPFSDPHIDRAIELFGRIVRDDQFVSGGAVGQSNLHFNKAIAGLFTSPPSCYLTYQASFIAEELKDQTASSDLGVFYLPNFASSQERPVLVSAPLVTLTTESEAAWALIAYLQTGLASELWAAQGHFLSPRSDLRLELYPTSYYVQQAQILTSATSFRFDGSEQMPGPVRGAFYGALMDYVNGAELGVLTPGIEAIWQGLEQQATE